MIGPQEYFPYSNRVLTSESVPLRDIAQAVGTPVYVYSKQALLKPLEELKSGLSGLDFTICYAMKSNSNLSIVKTLTEHGAGLDLVSGGELFRAKKLKVPPEKIVFSGVGKTTEEIKAALSYGKNGIYSFNVESIPELQQINEVAKSVKRLARVAIRVNPNIDAKTHPYISTGLHKNKFGIPYSEIFSIIKQIKTLPWIRLTGLSVHIGSQILSLSPLKKAFQNVQQLIENASETLKDPLEFVDLGGGLGITYHREKSPSLQKYCELIQTYFSNQSLKVLIEPGRVLTGNSGVLISQVLYRKQTQGRDFLIIDAGMNDLIRPALYGSFHQIIPLHQKKPGEKMKKMNVVGPVCESSDCFAEKRPLPDSLRSGDLVALLSAGAYGMSMASQYNSRLRPPEVLVDQNRFQIIRTRESDSDLIRNELL